MNQARLMDQAIELIAAVKSGELKPIFSRQIPTTKKTATNQKPDIKQSSVGTWLAEKFKQSIGAIPCGGCKQLMESLNTMSVDEISQNRERIITQIEANSKTATVKWWARVVAYADDTLTGGTLTRCMVGRWLDEAIEAEKAHAEAKIDLDEAAADMQDAGETESES